MLFPAIFSIWVSFHDVGLGNINNVFTAPFVGFANYRNVFNDFAFKWQGPGNWGAAVTSVVYSFAATALTLFLGLVAALMLNRPFRGRGLTRATFLFPYVAPVISVAFVWRWLLDPRPSGVANDILLRLGLIDTPMAFLSTRGLALFIVILFEGWRYFPFAMLMIWRAFRPLTPYSTKRLKPTALQPGRSCVSSPCRNCSTFWARSSCCV